MRAAVLVLAVSIAFPVTLPAQSGPAAAIPKNISPGLQHLLQHLATDTPIDLSKEGFALDRTGKAVHGSATALKVIYDKQNRVLVDVHLNGQMAIEAMKQALEKGGARVVAHSATYHQGVVEAYMPITSVADAARLSGTQHISLQYRPMVNVGATTSQGTIVMRSDVANKLGFDGTGTTVGILSDSYNTSQFAGLTTTTALQDVGTGDLPNNTSVPGCEGLKYCVELPAPGTDEGRGMAQIVHDVAPGAQLCFATAFAGEVQFGLNILDLAFNPACAADVVTDDVIYFDEPMFSDGFVAQAAQAVHDTGVSYFSSAGNQAFSGYSSRLRIIADAAARALPGQAVNLNTIPPTDPYNNNIPIDTTGGFQNFITDGGAPVISQFIAVADLTVFSFQWDDPFPGPQSTDLDLHFFDPSTGNWLFSVDTDNFALGEPLELFELTSSGGMGGGPPLFLQMAISRKGKNTVTGLPAANLSQRVRYVTFGSIAGDHIDALTATTFGHSCAAGANGVAAYRYNIYPGFDWDVPGTRPGPTRPELEYFSSPGPVEIFFDANGNRLDRAQLRLKPDIAAPDGVNTTFFPQPELGGFDYEALYGIPDGFPNFFGTSAAAPHAAGVAALLIQKGGGPGAVSPDSVHRALIDSAPPRDGDIFLSRAISSDDEDGPGVTITAADPEFLDLFTGTNAGRDPNFFTVAFKSQDPKVTLQSLALNLTNSGQAFRPGTFPVTQGTSSPGVSIASSSPSTLSQTLTVNFSGFTPGKVLRFGVYRVFDKGGVAVGTGGKAADIMGGDTFTATLSNGKTLRGTFRNDFDRGYRVYDGFGLIDAVDALKRVGDDDHDKH